MSKNPTSRRRPTLAIAEAPIAREELEAPKVETPEVAPLVLEPTPSLEELKAEEDAAKAYLRNLRARTAELRAQQKAAKKAGAGAPSTGPVARARAEMRAAIEEGLRFSEIAVNVDAGEIIRAVGTIFDAIERMRTAKRAAAKATKAAKKAAA